LAAAAILDFCQSASSLVCPSHGAHVGKPQKFDNFKTLIRKRPQLWNPFDLAQTQAN